jgi:hypothetical protein
LAESLAREKRDGEQRRQHEPSKGCPHRKRIGRFEAAAQALKAYQALVLRAYEARRSRRNLDEKRRGGTRGSSGPRGSPPPLTGAQFVLGLSSSSAGPKGPGHPAKLDASYC